jgi:hypothetical protein
MRRGFVRPRGWVVDGGAIAALLAVVAPGHATTRRSVKTWEMDKRQVTRKEVGGACETYIQKIVETKAKNHL